MAESIEVNGFGASSMILRVGAFFAVGSAAYVFLATLFWLVCVVLGHNILEMMYGGTAVYLFTFAAAVEGAWFLLEEIRRSSSLTRLTQRFRSSCD